MSACHLAFVPCVKTRPVTLLLCLWHQVTPLTADSSNVWQSPLWTLPTYHPLLWADGGHTQDWCKRKYNMLLAVQVERIYKGRNQS